MKFNVKKICTVMITVLVPFSLIACSNNSNDTENNSTSVVNKTEDSKVLVTYFSHSGNTRKIAEKIHEQVGGDIFEINTTYDYPENYDDVVNQAKEEQKDNKRPELKAKVDNMSDYDVVFIGYPNWWSDMPMVVYSFLDEYDFSGKTVIPFCTHGGSGLSDTEKAIKDLEPNAAILEGLAIKDTKVDDSDKDITKWLKKVGMIN